MKLSKRPIMASLCAVAIGAVLAVSDRTRSDAEEVLDGVRPCNSDEIAKIEKAEAFIREHRDEITHVVNSFCGPDKSPGKCQGLDMKQILDSYDEPQSVSIVCSDTNSLSTATGHTLAADITDIKPLVEKKLGMKLPGELQAYFPSLFTSNHLNTSDLCTLVGTSIHERVHSIGRIFHEDDLPIFDDGAYKAGMYSNFTCAAIEDDSDPGATLSKRLMKAFEKFRNRH